MYQLVLVGAIFGVAALMAYLAANVNERQQAFKFLYFGLMLLFVVYGIYQVALLPNVPIVRLNYTSEDSLYWNCSHTIYTEEPGLCWGEPEQNSCELYDIDQCYGISGCAWDDVDDVCYLAPDNCTIVGEYDPTGFKCEYETLGCYWEPGGETPEQITALCDSVNVTYFYGNYSSGYEEFGNSALTLAFVLLMVLVLLVFYLLVTYGATLIAILETGKPPKTDMDNEYGRPYGD